MDEERLNKALNNRIREVFDHYEDTGADEGWQLLRQKFPVQRKDRTPGWLWYAAAAVVLLFSAIWFISQTNKITPTVVSAQNRQSRPRQNTAGLPANIAGANTPQMAANVIKPITKPLITVPGHNAINTVAGAVAYNPAGSGSPSTVTPAAKQNSVITTPFTTPATNLTTANTPNKLPPDTGLQLTPVTPIPTTPLPVAKHKKDIYELLAQKTNEYDQPVKKAGNKPVISVYAATYFNYAKGSDSRVNVGAGFSSDFHITNKLKLSTGLAIAQNSLNYNNGTEPNPQRHEAAFASLATAVAKANGSPITGNGSAQSLAAFATNLGGTKNYNASLVGLDIPVNLKYEFNPQKSDAYVSAGLSSGTFINETYREVYSYSQISRENATHNSFSGFDVAKTLNFSFGVGYPLGKSNRLIVEPFFKYPLDGLGQQQIRFGAGGVNLKLNFRSLNK